MVRYQFSDPNEFEKLPAEKKRKICGWDNVTAVYRKRVLEEVPFRSVSFAEDALWAKDALLSGFSIVYNYAARVYHYHYEDPDYILKRAIAEYYHMYLHFQWVPSMPNSFNRHLRILKRLGSEKGLNLRDRLRWYLLNIKAERMLRRSVKLFLNAVRKGEKYLEELHNEVCKITPVAKNNPFKPNLQ